MGLTLHLGVLVVGYSDASDSGAKDTGEVADLLEQRYHIMETFYQLRREKIAGYLADSMANSIQMLVNSGRRIDTAVRGTSASHVLAGVKRTVSGDQSGSLAYSADQKIEADFRAFLYGGEMNRMFKALTGQEISDAAARGVSHRKKHPYAQSNPARPFAVDTGLYASSFRVWSSES